MNNSLIYLVTPTTATIAADGVLPLTTIVRRRCSSIQQSNDSIILNAPGYYKVSVTATLTAPAAGDVTIALKQNGLDVQGATASTTITTADTEVRSLSFDTIVRVTCGAVPTILTLVNEGVGITTSNIAITVSYIN